MAELKEAETSSIKYDVNIFGSKIRKMEGIVRGIRKKNLYSPEGIG